MHIQEHVGALQPDRGSPAVAVVEVVDDAIFHPVGHISGIAEFRAVYSGVDCESGVGSKIFFPFDISDGVVEFVGVRGREFENRFQNPECGPAAEIRLVHYFKVTFKRDHAQAGLHISGTEIDEFLAQHVFQSLECLGHHLEIVAGSGSRLLG